MTIKRLLKVVGYGLLSLFISFMLVASLLASGGSDYWTEIATTLFWIWVGVMLLLVIMSCVFREVKQDQE